MKDQIDALRKEAEAIRESLGAKLKQITDLENSCPHNWTEPKRIYDSNYAHSTYNRKWQRECTNCGKVDVTYREAMQPVPVFGDNSGKITIPNLGG